MPRTVLFCSRWLPVLVWMLLIFSASGDSLSFGQSSRIIGPIARWLFPDLSDGSIHDIVVLVRKGAHVAEYAVLSLVLWWALRDPMEPKPSRWQWSKAGLVLALVVLYAASDELHQAFVPSRQGSIWDVLLDSLGGALALLGLCAFSWWRQNRLKCNP